ncbi:MAG TPA: acetyl-CoA carboxylase carboxyltransferase subunit alpha [Blastocatellia bacterium]|nr:acetyl-CoA carboxylase carboxyltransferase subunit alpha [Blastocatellia bacterium]
MSEEQNKEVKELEQAIADLGELAKGIEQNSEILKLQQRLEHLKTEILDSLTPMDRVKLARHPNRPYTLDYVQLIFTDFSEVHGDRRYADDPAMVCGMANYHGEPVAVIGTQKGRDIKSRQYRNFGMAQPEGYRKALRVMKLAEKFNRPIFTFIDTPGAYPGIEAEERNIAEAIAYNLREMARMGVPIIATIIGEGCSGGALGIGIADRVLMQENTYYTVIAPESCSAILWRDQNHASQAAEALRLTAFDLKSFNVIDEIIEEPKPGAHSQQELAAEMLDQALTRSLNEIRQWSPEERIRRRYDKFRAMGSVQEIVAQRKRV